MAPCVGPVSLERRAADHRLEADKCLPRESRTVGRYLRYGTSIPTVSYYVGKKMLSQVKSRVTSFLFQLILNRLLGRVLKKKLQEIDVHDGIVTCNNVALDEKAVGALLLQ